MPTKTATTKAKGGRRVEPAPLGMTVGLRPAGLFSTFAEILGVESRAEVVEAPGSWMTWAGEVVHALELRVALEEFARVTGLPAHAVRKAAPRSARLLSAADVRRLRGLPIG